MSNKEDMDILFEMIEVLQEGLINTINGKFHNNTRIGEVDKELQELFKTIYN